ncbi:hypothetical protein Ancab_032542 [Ancistrocladus abbreviatus]
MSTKPNHREITPAIGRRARQTHLPSPSPHRRHPTPPLLKALQHIDILPKYCSEPLLQIGDLVTGDGRRSFESDGLLCLRQTCSDVLSFPSNLLESPKRRQLEELISFKQGKDAKVLVNVAVEGSPGPIRTMVKLGSSVEDTIKHVIRKYAEEGRSPGLDKSETSSFDLHLSYFSLESLDRSSAIGEVGSRNFYLRSNSGSKASGAGNKPDAASASVTSEIVHVKESYSRAPSPLVFLSAQITRKFTKIMRKMHKLWKILGCIH